MIKEIVGASLSSSSLVVCLTSIFHLLFDALAFLSSMTIIFWFLNSHLGGDFFVVWFDGQQHYDCRHEILGLKLNESYIYYEHVYNIYFVSQIVGPCGMGAYII